MVKLTSCKACDGFVPLHALTCPNCDRPTTLRKALNVCGGGAIAMTLMACYGGPPKKADNAEQLDCFDNATTAVEYEACEAHANSDPG